MALSFYVQKQEPTGVGFSYRRFNEFRHRIARSIGLKGVYAGTDTDMYMTGKYKEIGEYHPLYEFIAHSDCDGELDDRDCKKIGECLKTIILEWEKELDDDYDKELENDINEGRKLADLMLDCCENGDTLLFI
jgi:hypothetical protein